MVHISFGTTDAYTPVVRTARQDTARRAAMEFLERAVAQRMPTRCVKVAFQGHSLPDRKLKAK